MAESYILGCKRLISFSPEKIPLAYGMVNAMRHTVFNSCSASQKKMIVAVGISLIDYGSQGSWATRHEHISCSFVLCQFLLEVFEQLSEQR